MRLGLWCQSGALRIGKALHRGVTAVFRKKKYNIYQSAACSKSPLCCWDSTFRAQQKEKEKGVRGETLVSMT